MAQQLDELRRQNQALQSQLQQQQRMIDRFTQQFAGLQKTNELQQSNYAQPKTSMDEGEAKKSRFLIGNAILSGEGGVGFFESQR